MVEATAEPWKTKVSNLWLCDEITLKAIPFIDVKDGERTRSRAHYPTAGGLKFRASGADSEMDNSMNIKPGASWPLMGAKVFVVDATERGRSLEFMIDGQKVVEKDFVKPGIYALRVKMLKKGSRYLESWEVWQNPMKKTAAGRDYWVCSEEAGSKRLFGLQPDTTRWPTAEEKAAGASNELVQISLQDAIRAVTKDVRAESDGAKRAGSVSVIGGSSPISVSEALYSRCHKWQTEDKHDLQIVVEPPKEQKERVLQNRQQIIAEQQVVLNARATKNVARAAAPAPAPVAPASAPVAGAPTAPTGSQDRKSLADIGLGDDSSAAPSVPAPVGSPDLADRDL